MLLELSAFTLNTRPSDNLLPFLLLHSVTKCNRSRGVVAHLAARRTETQRKVYYIFECGNIVAAKHKSTPSAPLRNKQMLLFGYRHAHTHTHTPDIPIHVIKTWAINLPGIQFHSNYALAVEKIKTIYSLCELFVCKN